MQLYAIEKGKKNYHYTAPHGFVDVQKERKTEKQTNFSRNISIHTSKGKSCCPVTEANSPSKNNPAIMVSGYQYSFNFFLSL